MLDISSSVYLISASLGASFGSFMTTLCFRREARKQQQTLRGWLHVLSKPSFCPSCQTKIRPRNNIPIISYFLLKGKCSSCKTRIPSLCVVYEILGAVLFSLAIDIMSIERTVIQSLLAFLCLYLFASLTSTSKIETQHTKRFNEYNLASVRPTQLTKKELK